MRSPKLFAAALFAALALPVVLPAIAAAPLPATVAPDAADAIGSAGAGDLVRLIVTFDPAADRTAVLTAHGLSPAIVFESFPVAVADGTPLQWRALAADGLVRAVEADRQLQYYMNTAVFATRAAQVAAGAVTLNGAPLPLDGSGVGVAVVDTGTDCVHPDLAGACVSGRNLKNVPFTTLYRHVPNSDEHVGHGTHVAGIAVGDGTMSNGRVMGVAPGASLYSYAHGVGIHVIGILVAWDHIIQNPAWPGAPRILVVSNSFGGSGDPSAADTEAVRALVAAGMTVVFAAGNEGDDGASADMVNSYCKVRGPNDAPLPGVVCVANYADGHIGSSEGGLDYSSSRGSQSNGDSWPDLAAPGHLIRATRATTGLVVVAPLIAAKYGDTDLPFYTTVSGTSMSAPHVTGVVALMQQARMEAGLPVLSPAAVESILVTSAHEFANYESFPNRHAGHGLVDARAAVEAALGLGETPMTPSLQQYVSEFYGILFSGRGARVNPGAPVSLVNGEADYYGFGEPLPAAHVITPGASGVSVRAFMDDAGGTTLSAIRTSATVKATVEYVGSGTVAFDGFLTRAIDGSAFNGPLIAYSSADGDVRLTLVFDVQGDGVHDARTDRVETTVYSATV